MSECDFPKIWKNETNDKCVTKCPEGTCPRYDIYGKFKCAKNCSLTTARNLATGILNIGSKLTIGNSISDHGTHFDANENRQSGIYYGPLSSGVPEDIGLMTFDNGMIYYGDWNLGKMDGKGIILDSNGTLIYDGYFTNDMMDVRGKHVYDNGDTYIGEYRNGKMHGIGKWIGANGDIYEGEWSDDKINGRGKFIWVDGSVYDGEWKQGQKSGKGKFINNNGSTYEGLFISDQPAIGKLLPYGFCQGHMLIPTAPPSDY